MTKCYIPILYIAFSVFERLLPAPAGNDAIGYGTQANLEKHKEIYKEFVDDRVAEVKEEYVDALRRKRFDKFRYVSCEFVERNGGVVSSSGGMHENTEMAATAESEENNEDQYQRFAMPDESIDMDDAETSLILRRSKRGSGISNDARDSKPGGKVQRIKTNSKKKRTTSEMKGNKRGKNN